jgi:hypothetical protein
MNKLRAKRLADIPLRDAAINHSKVAPRICSTDLSRCGLARSPLRKKPRLWRLREIGRQIDVPTVGKFEIPR